MKIHPFFLKQSLAVVWGTMLASCLAVGAAMATDGPIPETITKTGLSVIVRDFVRMPQTGIPTYARINFLREEPGGADRLFVNDLNGPLYAVDKASKAVSTYIDFTNTFPSLKT